jgi:Spo0E like sporulation regulatory protein.
MRGVRFFIMNILGLKKQRLKRDIEETREKLNVLVDQKALDISEEVLDTSQRLDILIANYYCILVEEDK